MRKQVSTVNTIPKRSFGRLSTHVGGGAWVSAVVAILFGCGSSTTSTIAGTGAGNNGQAGGGLILPGSSGGAGNVGAGGLGSGQLPAGFTPATIGGWLVGDPFNGTDTGGSAGASTTGCGTTIRGIIRDFQASHPDFEKTVADDKGIVRATLGADRKPVYASTGPTRTVRGGPDSFNQWYRNVAGVNQALAMDFFFGPNASVFSFQSNAFFPLDGKGFGNQGNPHNFHFTTEIHTEFKYNGGETFNFTGDDDVFVFINNQLVIDLGGVHGAENDSVNIDMVAARLGLTVGSVYPFDMFQAERHLSESNFRADTDLNFVDCGTIVPDVPPR